MKNNVVGWVSFVSEEVTALDEAVTALHVIYKKLPPDKEAEFAEQHKYIQDVLAGARAYIAENIGKHNTVNPFLPAVKHMPLFSPNWDGFVRLQKAQEYLDKIFASVKFDLQKEIGPKYTEAHEALHSMARHVGWVINYR